MTALVLGGIATPHDPGLIAPGTAAEHSAFWSNVERQDPVACWRWLGRFQHGYPCYGWYGRTISAARLAYSLLRCPLPVSFAAPLEHRCGAAWCINPWHLRIRLSQTDKERFERFWEKVDRREPSGCWLWLGACHVPSGRGKYLFYGRWERVHRLAYQWMVGPLVAGQPVLQTCGQVRCVNPLHLQPVAVC